MDITTKTVEELKVLAYDQIVLHGSTKKNIALLEAEINKRKEVKPEVKEEVKPEPAI